MIAGHTVSLTTGSMNRIEHLKRALPTWLAHPEIDEILLVDWGSEPLLAESLGEFADERIRIARVANREHWENACCHNLEFRLANGDLILRLDNDHLIGPEFFVRHPPEDGLFYAGNWRNVPPDSEARNLSGILWTWRGYLFMVNGYNERLCHYGVEDDDLYDRLFALGLVRRDIDIRTAEHIHHSDTDRLRNLRIVTERPDLLDNSRRAWDECIDNFTKSKSIVRDLSLAVNKQYPWTSRDAMTTWVCRKIDNRLWVVEEVMPGKVVMA
jgi:hypothetical protein